MKDNINSTIFHNFLVIVVSFRMYSWKELKEQFFFLRIKYFIRVLRKEEDVVNLLLADPNKTLLTPSREYETVLMTLEWQLKQKRRFSDRVWSYCTGRIVKEKSIINCAQFQAVKYV